MQSRHGGWPSRDIAAYMAAFTAWLAVSSAIAAHLAPASAPFYILFIPIAYLFSTGYLTCTKCCHHGENCYMMLGRISGRLFKKRSGGYTTGEMAGFTLSWLLVGSYPAALAALGRRWELLALHGSLAGLVVLLWLYRCGCPRCNNTTCPLNRGFSRA